MKDCKCHWEGSVFYADPDCILDESNPRYFENLKHDVPPSVPEWIPGDAHGLVLRARKPKWTQ